MSDLQKPIAVRSQNWSDETGPVVSIACLAYNHEKFIREAIESFLNQKTTFKVEILIHDDASEDRTAEIIKEYAAEWGELFSVVLQTENQYSKGKNPGEFNLRRAKGKYIAFCEGDDYWTDPLKLQKQVEFMENHRDYSVCVGGFSSYIDAENRIDKTYLYSNEDESEGGFTFTLEEMKHTWLTKLLTALVRSDVLRSFDPSVYQHYRDIHLFYHLIKDYKAFYIKEIFGIYRVHPGGINSMKQGVENSRTAHNCYKELYDQNRDDFTRHMCLKSALELFNYNLYHYHEDSSFSKNLHLYREAVQLVRNLTEAKWLFTAFIKASLKEKIKEVIG